MLIGGDARGPVSARSGAHGHLRRPGARSACRAQAPGSEIKEVLS